MVSAVLFTLFCGSSVNYAKEQQVRNYLESDFGYNLNNLAPLKDDKEQKEDDAFTKDTLEHRGNNMNPNTYLRGDHLTYKNFHYGGAGPRSDTTAKDRMSPAVMYDTKSTIGVINHIYGSTAQTTTAVFNLIGGPSDYVGSQGTDKSSLILGLPVKGTGENSAVLTSKITGVMPGIITSKDVTGEFKMYPNRAGNAITHLLTVTNSSTKEISFTPIKQVDTMLGDNDKVPIYARGPNKGLYIQSIDKKYRLDYVMDVPDGPTQYSGKMYNTTYNNVFTGTWEAPKSPDTLKNEDQIVLQNVDTGIFMAWDKKTLAPGETATMRYDVGIKNEADLVIEKKAENLTRPADLYRVGDEVRYTVEVLAPQSNYEDVKLVDVLPLEVEGLKNIKLKTADETILNLNVEDVYNQTTRKITLPAYVVNKSKKIELSYEVKLSPTAAGKTIINEASVTGQSGQTFSEVSTAHELIVEKKMGQVIIHYTYLDGNQLADDKNIEGVVDESYAESPIPISDYTYQDTIGDASGVFTEETQEVTFRYRNNEHRVNAHLRQVIVEANMELTVPQNGFGQFISQTNQKRVNITMDSSESLSQAFSNYLIVSQYTENIQLFKPVVPMYYQLVGYVITTSSDIEHQLSDSSPEPVEIDVSNTPEFWLTMYIKPNANPYPYLYNWYYLDNGVKEIQRE